MAMRFEPDRQLEPGPEGCERLVYGEARIIRGDFEQHVAGLAEVDRPEVVAVELLGRGDTLACERAAQRVLGTVVGGAEGDVVDRAGTDVPRGKPATIRRSIRRPMVAPPAAGATKR